jgi:hypothetical protein
MPAWTTRISRRSDSGTDRICGFTTATTLASISPSALGDRGLRGRSRRSPVDRRMNPSCDGRRGTGDLGGVPSRAPAAASNPAHQPRRPWQVWTALAGPRQVARRRDRVRDHARRRPASATADRASPSTAAARVWCGPRLRLLHQDLLVGKRGDLSKVRYAQHLVSPGTPGNRPTAVPASPPIPRRPRQKQAWVGRPGTRDERHPAQLAARLSTAGGPTDSPALRPGRSPRRRRRQSARQLVATPGLRLGLASSWDGGHRLTERGRHSSGW